MDRRYALAGLLTVAIAGATSRPANACSTSWKRGSSPKEVRNREDVIAVKGTYKLDEFAGIRRTDEDGVERVYEARFLGTITSMSGRRWKTIHEPIAETGITCVDVLAMEFRKPEGDAQGTFWIEANTRKRRHKLLDWDGEYLPDAEQTPLKVN